jgi:hypothetical protein
MGTLSQDGLNNDFYSESLGSMALRGELPGLPLLRAAINNYFTTEYFQQNGITLHSS